MIAWKEQYGNPNIPMGSSGGNYCKTLRRLHIQKKLTEDEISMLNGLGFQFNDLEDVYFEADFDFMLLRLKRYEEQYKNKYQVPKKYPNDPELGAWVTGLRRLGPEKVHDDHVKKLNDIEFTWVSRRKCGSKFMNQYRALKGRVDKEGLETVLQDDSVQKWIKIQRMARLRDALSDTRFHYMVELLGDNWMENKEKR